MDALTILGIRGAPKTNSELKKLLIRAKELRKHYKKQNKPQEVKKVDWAFEHFSKKLGGFKEKKVQGPAAPKPTETETSKRPAEGEEFEEQPDAKRPAESQQAPQNREEAIREKLAARRSGAETKSTEEDRRREQIRDRLAIKRVVKNVPHRGEEEAKTCHLELLAAIAATAISDREPGRLSLLCPVSGERIKSPARGKGCQHLQCFDLEAFLLSKSSCCPVCSVSAAPPGELYTDAFLQKVLQATGPEVKAVAFDPSGHWQACSAPQAEDKKEKEESSAESMTPIPESPEMPEDPAPSTEQSARKKADAAKARKAAEVKKAAEAAAAKARKAADAAKAAETAVAKARKKAAATKAAQEAAAKKAEADTAAAKQAEEERKLKALLPFIPKGRAEAKQKSAAAEARTRPEVMETEDAPAADVTDENNYVVVELSRPMGIVFSANAHPIRGVCIASLDEGGPGALHGRLREGDQLVAIGHTSVLGFDVDSCIDGVVADPNPMITLTLFRGRAQDLYGKSGPSSDWIANLLAKVRNGTLRPYPPLEKRSGKQARLSMTLSDDDDEASSGAADGEMVTT